MKEELISVIIPVYNIEGYLPRCLETVAAQTYHNLEIILVDDCSTDSSRQICEDFAERDNRVIVLGLPHKECVAVARNRGKEMAHGEYIYFMDGDDYMHHDALRLMHEAINQNGGYDMAVMNYKMTESLEEDTTQDVGDIEASELTRDELIAHLHRAYGPFTCYVWQKLFRRQLIQNLWFDYPWAEDIDFHFRSCLNIHKAVWIRSRPLYFYVQRKGSIMHQGDVDAWCENYSVMTDILYTNYKQLPADKQEYGYYLLKRLYRRLAEWRYVARNSDRKAEVKARCREYVQATRKAYWTNRRISLAEKVAWTLQLSFPSLVTCSLWVRKQMIRGGLRLR